MGNPSVINSCKTQEGLGGYPYFGITGQKIGTKNATVEMEISKS